MRTTLILNDSLVAYAKKTAAEKQSSLSAVVNDALRLSMQQEGRPKKNNKDFRMICYRGNVKKTDTLPSGFAHLQELDDLESFSS